MKTRYNEDVKQKVKEKGITLCELAFKAQISESALFQWLRHPMTDERRQILLNAMEN